MKEYAVIFSHPNNVGLDGYAGLNAHDDRRRNRAVFTTRHQAEVYAASRATPGCTFTVVEFDP